MTKIPEIRVLDSHLIDKIAAGEVIERPASVIKELLDNAVDGGATRISAEAAEYLIRVTDNGSGIPREQAETAFLRHATSKITSIDDLETILTMGFRGEALSSIAGVSQVEMLTRTAQENNGTRVLIEGGRFDSVSSAACNVGTSFAVRNLFYNVPARRKFLKKPAAENALISEAVKQHALCNFNIQYTYTLNGSEMFRTAGHSPRSAFSSVYGREVAQNLRDVDYTQDGFRITGFVSEPTQTRGNRGLYHFFINRRMIKSEILTHAVEDAYRTRIFAGRFPVFALYLDIDPSAIDVNVHPAKLHIRFSDEHAAYNAVYAAVQSALERVIAVPSVKLAPITKTEQIDAFSVMTIEPTHTKPTINLERIVLHDSSTLSALADHPPEQSALADRANSPEVTLKPATEKAARAHFSHPTIIGQLFGTYWLFTQDDSMYMIDQHAAHERILFERFTDAFKSKQQLSQPLLMPVALELTDREAAALTENEELLTALGFEIEHFGYNTFALRAVPIVFDEPAGFGFVNEIIDMLTRSPKDSANTYDVRVEKLAMLSCKAAVKGNAHMSYQESEALIKELLTLENPFTCPHGRPTIIEITRAEIERKFLRT